MSTKAKPATFADRLRELRTAASLSQAKLASAAGISTNQVARIERGERVPGWDTACKLAAALGVSLDQFRG